MNALLAQTHTSSLSFFSSFLIIILSITLTLSSLLFVVVPILAPLSFTLFSFFLSRQRSQLLPQKQPRLLEQMVGAVCLLGDGGGKPKLDFEETELRLGLGLGLPGGGEKHEEDLCKNVNANGKRNFVQTVDLKLNLASTEAGRDSTDKPKNLQKGKDLLPISNEEKPPAKAQVVGWPPVQSFRKNILAVQKNSVEESDKGTGSAALVKVSMDGAPYLRKVDLKMYKSYQELSDALGKMFQSFTIGNCESQGMMDFMNESKLIDLLNSSDYVPTYEDKDGDWMLVGDVPWEMFVESCKRLRIMKGTEAIGLAPRALAKCKNRS